MNANKAQQYKAQHYYVYVVRDMMLYLNIA